jgi:hypothetical protein
MLITLDDSSEKVLAAEHPLVQDLLLSFDQSVTVLQLGKISLLSSVPGLRYVHQSRALSFRFLNVRERDEIFVIAPIHKSACGLNLCDFCCGLRWHFWPFPLGANTRRSSVNLLLMINHIRKTVSPHEKVPLSIKRKRSMHRTFVSETI